MRKKSIILLFMLIFVGFIMGLNRHRYDPIWRTVSGGIEYSAGDVTIASGDLNITDGNISRSTDTYMVMKTVIKTINLDSSDDDEDFEFDDSQTNVTEQSVNLGAIVPAFAELSSAQIRCFEAVVGGTMSIDLGTTTGGSQILGAANTDALNEINKTDPGEAPEVGAGNTTKNVWINATPSANWSTLSAGKWSVMITYIDYDEIHTAKNP